MEQVHKISQTKNEIRFPDWTMKNLSSLSNVLTWRLATKIEKWNTTPIMWTAMTPTTVSAN